MPAHDLVTADRFRDTLTSLTLVSWPDLDTAVEQICRAAGDAMGVARVSVWRQAKSRPELRSRPHWHNGIEGWDVDVVSEGTHPIYWRALTSARVLAVDDAMHDDVLAEFRTDYLPRHSIGAMLDSAIRTGEETLGIVCFEHVGGARHWTAEEQSFAASIADRAALAFLLDEQRRLEADLRETQKMEAVGMLAGGVAHDFNNVLNVITTSTELAREAYAAGEDIGHDLDAIADAASRAMQLTRQLLRIARREQIRREHHDLSALVRAFEPMMRSLARQHVALALELAATSLPIMADRAVVDQALLNLVTNAVQAMPDGGALTIETARLVTVDAEPVHGRHLPHGAYARLTVRDTGVGIPVDAQHRIFEPFFTTKGEHGTGLGLSVVYGTVRQHGGYVAVESAPGQGASFHLLFPLALS